MNTTTKRYTPTATARPSWRDREAQKERTQREAARLAIEEAEQKKIALVNLLSAQPDNCSTRSWLPAE
jgi:hypothetical protein